MDGLGQEGGQKGGRYRIGRVIHVMRGTRAKR